MEKIYCRVRKSWADANFQKGTFTLLENAKRCADGNPVQGGSAWITMRNYKRIRVEREGCSWRGYCEQLFFVKKLTGRTK